MKATEPYRIRNWKQRKNRQVLLAI